MFAIPQFALEPSAVKGFMDAWPGFHTAFRECFARSEPRDHFFPYMVGQFSELNRTTRHWYTGIPEAPVRPAVRRISLYQSYVD